MLTQENYQIREEDLLQEPTSFKQALAELKIVLGLLEGANSDLDYSILLFKRGNYLSQWSNNYLNKMEEEINKLSLPNNNSQEQ